MAYFTPPLHLSQWKGLIKLHLAIEMTSREGKELPKFEANDAKGVCTTHI